MPAIPPFLLKKLYVNGSLRTKDGGFTLDLRNVIAPGTITAFTGLDVDGQPVDPTLVTIVPPSGPPRSMGEISDQATLHFPVGANVTLRVAGQTLDPGPHEIIIRVLVQEIGPLDIPVSDTVE